MLHSSNGDKCCFKCSKHSCLWQSMTAALRCNKPRSTCSWYLLLLCRQWDHTGPHQPRTLLREVAALGLCILSPQPALFLLQSGKDKNAIDKVFKNLDENGDSQVDFKEFVLFVAALTCCCHRYFEQNAAK